MSMILGSVTVLLLAVAATCVIQRLYAASILCVILAATSGFLFFLPKLTTESKIEHSVGRPVTVEEFDNRFEVVEEIAPIVELGLDRVILRRDDHQLFAALDPSGTLQKGDRVGMKRVLWSESLANHQSSVYVAYPLTIPPTSQPK